MLQALSEAVHACVQAQMEENMRFWTYLQHLEAWKYQCALYMKSKYAEFPDLLLQQFNFGKADKTAAIKGSKDVAAGKEREWESEEDQQPKQKEVKDVEVET